MTIVIPNYRTKGRNSTATKHWRVYQEHRDIIAGLIRKYCTDKSVIPCAQVTIVAYFKGKRALDTSNIDDKFVLDGLMHAGVLEDDAPAFNPEVVKRSVPNSGKDELHIIVEPLPAS